MYIIFVVILFLIILFYFYKVLELNKQEKNKIFKIN